MFHELIEKLLPNISNFKIHYFSIGCAESKTSTNDPKYICQQFPIDLQNRSEDMCLYLIDSELYPVTYVEELLNSKEYQLISNNKLISIQNSFIKQYKSSKNTIQLVILRSNEIYTYHYKDEKYIMPIDNFDFFTLLISIIYDNNNIAIFQTYSGQHLKIIDKYCKMNGYYDKILVGITCGRDFSCYVPNTFLSKLYFKKKFNSIHIKNPNKIPNFCIRNKFLKHTIDSEYGKQLLYLMNYRIYTELRLTANLLDFTVIRYIKNEYILLSEIIYYSDIPDYDTIKESVMTHNPLLVIIHQIKLIFRNQVMQCNYFLPEYCRIEYSIDEINNKTDSITSINFVNNMYNNFKNIYPIDKICIEY